MLSCNLKKNVFINIKRKQEKKNGGWGRRGWVRGGGGGRGADSRLSYLNAIPLNICSSLISARTCLALSIE